MTSKTLTYCPVSPSAFEAIRADLASHDVNLPDTPSGTTNAGHGYTVAWELCHPAAASGQGWLSVTINGPGIFMDMAVSKIDALIKPHVG